MDHLNQPTETMQRDNSPSAAQARIILFCNITGDEPVKLKVRKGELSLTDQLIDWCKTTGASLDWINSGDLAPMIRVCRRAHQAEQSVIEFAQRIPDHILPSVVAALKAHAAGLMPLDQALEAMRQAVVVDEVAAKG